MIERIACMFSFSTAEMNVDVDFDKEFLNTVHSILKFLARHI